MSFKNIDYINFYTYVNLFEKWTFIVVLYRNYRFIIDSVCVNVYVFMIVLEILQYIVEGIKIIFGIVNLV